MASQRLAAADAAAQLTTRRATTCHGGASAAVTLFAAAAVATLPPSSSPLIGCIVALSDCLLLSIVVRVILHSLPAAMIVRVWRTFSRRLPISPLYHSQLVQLRTEDWQKATDLTGCSASGADSSVGSPGGTQSTCLSARARCKFNHKRSLQHSSGNGARNYWPARVLFRRIVSV